MLKGILSLFPLLLFLRSLEAAKFLDNSNNNNDNYHRNLFQFSSECDYDETLPYYVSSSSGKNWNTGLSTDKPFQTIQHAINNRMDCQIIYVMEGIYRNKDFGTSNNKNHKNKIIWLNGVANLKILGYPGSTKPILEFDGPGAIIGGSKTSPVSNIEIANLEIRGPNRNINWQEAMDDRLTKSSYYNGRGIAIWAGHHIYLHDLVVHDCPASGLRVNRGDYITISNNVVYNTTFWTSSAESAIVLAASEHIDRYDGVKMRLLNNTVYNNINKVPYYNPNYDWDYSPLKSNCGSYSACEQELVEDCPWQCRYGHKTQDYIIDGMGVYVTRNSDTYLHGMMELSYNTCYGNGINGLGFHRTHRGTIKQNLIYNNGVVPRLDKPEVVEEDWQKFLGKSRQPFSGITINNAKSVNLCSNRVAARYDDDFAYRQVTDNNGQSQHLEVGGNNKVCKGKINSTFITIVDRVYSEDTMICQERIMQ